MKKIMFLTGSRGEWGYIRPILSLINKRDDVDYKLIVTNMHLLPSYGSSYKEILNDGFRIDHRLNMAIEADNHYTHAKSLGVCLISLPDILETEKPDFLVLAGDRGEQLMGAIAASYTYTPVAHIQAGELSGNIDGMARHAIGKMTHIHFAANQDAADRLIRLGEEPFRVHNVGAPQIDEMISGEIADFEQIKKGLGLSSLEKYVLAILHPVTEQAILAGDQAQIFTEALNKIDYPKILIMPNNDAGSTLIRRAIDKGRSGEYHIFSNLKREVYLGLLSSSQCIVGNSSSGLLEAPTYKKAAVNIGRRQQGRVQGINVINVDFNVREIREAIKKATSIEFNQHLQNACVNPYGDGTSSKQILDILLSAKIDEKLLAKNLTY